MAIHGYDGVPGSGKTLAAVNRLWRSRESGTPPYANIPLYDLRTDRFTGEPLNRATYGWPWAVYLENEDDLLSVRRGLILVDEVDMWFSAVNWQKVGFQSRRFWTQHRKQGLNIIWTCTFIDRVLNVVRDITELNYRCMRLPFLRRYSFQRAFNPQETGTHKKSSMWFAVKLHEDLFNLYRSGFVVGDGQTSGEMGAVDYGSDLPVTVGTTEEFQELASRGVLFRPVKDGEPVVVAPLMRPVVARELSVWCERIQRGGGTPSERVGAARLAPVLKLVRR